ncbi:MAG: DNA-3-methyladenine glycosylase 2 family protein [Nanoarchaeota archaeon]|nr:DNA-3-methyladenine glycosylase 2 family protein [Nanoarchaeota archaeon]
MKKAVEFLKKDLVMKGIIESVGEVKVDKSDDYFLSLVTSIMYQQLNSKAAKSIFDRFAEACGPVTPVNVFGLSDEVLKGCGLSRQKRSYLKSLAEHFLNNIITPGKFHELSDQEVVDELVQVRGLGVWSAQMFLMFSLGRLDVFAPLDYGLRKAIQVNYSLKEMPSPKEAEAFAERWKPYRTIASLYLWKSVD